MTPRSGILSAAAILLTTVLTGLAQSAEALSVREFEQPALTFPTGVAVAPDGGIWIASTYADKLVRFDPRSGQSREFPLALRSHPVGLLAEPAGAVWYAASGLGHVGRLEPDGKPREFAIPSMLRARSAIPSPWSITLDSRRSEIWVTVHSGGLVGRLPLSAAPQRRGFGVSEIGLGGAALRPDGIAADGRGGVWVAELGADRLARIGSADGSVTQVPLPVGSRPRGIAAGPDGVIWVTLFGVNQLLRLDPASLRTRTWPMPSGARSSPYAIGVTDAGVVWVAEFVGNAIVRFEPRTERMTVVALPTPRSRVRALAVDARGRVWFAGSASGRLGVVE
jgi:virginiamycin B lyase